MFLHHARGPAGGDPRDGPRAEAGGTLVITDADSHTHEWLRTEQHDRWLGFDRADIGAGSATPGSRTSTVGDTQEICSPTSECGTKAAITIFLARGRKPGPSERSESKGSCHERA